MSNVKVSKLSDVKCHMSVFLIKKKQNILNFTKNLTAGAFGGLGLKTIILNIFREFKYFKSVKPLSHLNHTIYAGYMKNVLPFRSASKKSSLEFQSRIIVLPKLVPFPLYGFLFFSLAFVCALPLIFRFRSIVDRYACNKTGVLSILFGKEPIS